MTETLHLQKQSEGGGAHSMRERDAGVLRKRTHMTRGNTCDVVVVVFLFTRRPPRRPGACGSCCQPRPARRGRCSGTRPRWGRGCRSRRRRVLRRRVLRVPHQRRLLHGNKRLRLRLRITRAGGGAGGGADGGGGHRDRARAADAPQRAVRRGARHGRHAADLHGEGPGGAQLRQGAHDRRRPGDPRGRHGQHLRPLGGIPAGARRRGLGITRRRHPAVGALRRMPGGDRPHRGHLGAAARGVHAQAQHRGADVHVRGAHALRAQQRGGARHGVQAGPRLPRQPQGCAGGERHVLDGGAQRGVRAGDAGPRGDGAVVRAAGHVLRLVPGAAHRAGPAAGARGPAAGPCDRHRRARRAQVLVHGRRRPRRGAADAGA
mmetsp:Transcript_24641/g.60556  ORF Transcript_24641/g.60556 Transcript_24641/m.60556 type:complete len:376 (-) Transcript_24641:757-1884(-)